MPIEIREISIKVNVEDNNSKSPKAAPVQAQDTESIIAECVERVLKALELKNER